MKRNLVLLLALAVLIIPTSLLAVDGEKVVIRIDGKVLETDGISPYIKNGTTFVPLRAISESLDYKIDWDPKDRIVTMEKGDTIVKLPIGNNIANLNGKDRRIAQPAELQKGTTYVPVRFVSEIIDYEVQYKKVKKDSFIDIVSPIAEKPIDKKKADEFIKNYVSDKNYDPIQYITADLNKDTIQDYILLVNFGSTFGDYIVLVDGKTEKELARTYILKDEGGNRLQAKRITDNNSKQIYFHAVNEGDDREYIFDYKDGKLKDIYFDISFLKNIENDHLFAYFIDYPSLNKVLCMKPAENIYFKMSESFSQVSSRDNAYYSKSYIGEMIKPGEITVYRDFTFSPLPNTKIRIEESYKWNNDKWDIKDAKIKNFNSNEYRAVESRYGNEDDYKSIYVNNVLNVTKTNAEKLFKASKNEITRICGEPSKIENGDYLSNDKYYRYNGFSVDYFGGNNKYPWGPSQILFGRGNNRVLGVNVGMSFNDAKRILGRPSYEGISEASGEYLMVYSFNGYDYYFVADSAKRVSSINIKETVEH